jgi:hypothetical protein
MKLIPSFYLTLLIGAVCLSGFSSSSYAFAPGIDQPGASCTNYNAAEVTDIDYLPNGVRNLNSSTRYVICPLAVVVDGAPNNVRLWVHVDVDLAAGTTVGCTLFLVNYRGYIVDSQYGEATAPSGGGWTQMILTVGTEVYSSASLLCPLPGNARGKLINYHVTAIGF